MTDNTKQLYVIQYETISFIPLSSPIYSVQHTNIGVLQVAVLSAPAGFVYAVTRPSSSIVNVRGFECNNLPCKKGVGQNGVTQTW